MKRLLIASTSLFSILAAPAMAEAPAPTPDVAGSALPSEIVVTGTRTPQPLYKIGSSITVLTQKFIESSQAVVVTDLLTQTPGVTYTRNGGVGGVTSLRIRGAETDQTTVILDGVKINDPSVTGGGYNFADLLIGDINRIEILRGSQSILWGSQAIGGVVNIVTAVPTKPFEVSADVEGGSRSTGYGRLGIGGADERLTWRLAGGYYTTDGISTYSGGTEHDGYHNAGFNGRVKYQLTDAVSVDVRGQYIRSRNQFDGFPPPLYSFADTSEYGTSRQYVGYAGINLDLFESRLKNRVAFGYTDVERHNYDPDQAVTTKTFDSVGRNTRFEYQGSLNIAEGWDAVFGVEHEKTEMRSAFISSFDPNPIPDAGSAKTTSGYAQIQAEIISGLTLTGGLRYDDHNIFGDHVVGQVSAAWALNEGDTVLRANFSQGFKAPSLYQMYSIYGNTGLKPESADTFDGGIEQHIGENLTVSAIGFYRKTKNQIDFVSCPSAHPLCSPTRWGVYDNIASTKAAGIELAGSAVFGSLTVQANYTYMDTENASVGNINRGKELARRPKNTANLSADYAWPWDVSTGVTLRYVGDAFDNAGNTFVLQDYMLVDLRASVTVMENVELYGRIENLFNETYATARDYGTARRGAFAGVRARF
jgi:vitamin B12 transporter